MSYTVDMHEAKAKIRQICTSSQLGIVAANSVQRHAEQYVPRREGNLRLMVTIKPWQVIYNVPYAHYQWEGRNIRNYTTPSTRSHWEQAVNKTDVAKELTNYLKGL